MLLSTGDRQHLHLLTTLLELDANDELVMYQSITDPSGETISHQGSTRKVDVGRANNLCFIHYMPDGKHEAVYVYDGKLFAQKVFDYLVGNTKLI